MRESSNSSSSSPSSSSTSVSDLFQSIFSYNGNVMLAALVSFLFVILFVLLLHVYAKWFFAAQARDTRRRSITVSRRLTHPRFSNFQPLTFDSSPTNSPTKGLDPSSIALIPLFVYEPDKKRNGLECVICLSDFEDLEIGRSLPKCSHAFHVECIDMWLSSHSSCPICRAPAAYEATGKMEEEIRN